MQKPISSNTTMKTSYYFSFDITDFVRGQYSASSKLLNFMDKVLHTKHLCWVISNLLSRSREPFAHWLVRATLDFLTLQKSVVRSPGPEHKQQERVALGRGQRGCWEQQGGNRMGWERQHKGLPVYQARGTMLWPNGKEGAGISKFYCK